jgi:hypothetical protein
VNHRIIAVLQKIKTLPGEGRVLLLILICLLLVEVAFRSGDQTLSKDVAHLKTLSAMATQIRATGETGQRSLLVLGNSLARCAVDFDVVRTDAATPSIPLPFLMAPDGSNIANWHYAFRRYMLHCKAHPSVVWILTGKTHLFDAPLEDPERMGHYFVDAQDRWSFLWNELPDTGTRSRFLLSTISTAFANRTRIQPLLFYNCVPGYEVTARDISQTLPVSSENPNQGQVNRPTFRHLNLLLDSIREAGCEATIISVPLPVSYELPPEVLTIAENHHVTVFEMGSAPPLPASAFSDGYHLTTAAAKEVTLRILDHTRVRKP